MANIYVDQEQWDQVSSEEKEAIIKALMEAGSLSGDDQVVAVEDGTKGELPSGERTLFLCKALCDAAAAAGKVACFNLTNPAAIAACIAVVEAARKECRRKC